ncbi:hypothetical protein AB0M43_03540 [Longispora sp. NPDC051575]|uniref:hypothetical protein n=1 Tax=Longispora sp. NPDC051575 TaxID=3154943 RepID=UPI003435CBCF
MSRTTRPAALAAALVLAATGVAVAVASPAQARPYCSSTFSITPASGTLHVDSQTTCPNGEEDTAYVRIQRWDPANGGWTVVASGYGTADYTCSGGATYLYAAHGGYWAERAQGYYSCG